VLNDTAGTAVALSVGEQLEHGLLREFERLGQFNQSRLGHDDALRCDTYTGFTVVSNGTLALASGALLANSSSIHGQQWRDVDVSRTPSLWPRTELARSGTNNGSITVASGAGITAGLIWLTELTRSRPT